MNHEELRILRDCMVGYLPMVHRIPLAKAIAAAGFTLQSKAPEDRVMSCQQPQAHPARCGCETREQAKRHHFGYFGDGQ